MNTLHVIGHITDPTKFNKFGDKENPGLFATVVMNKYKGNDEEGKAIKEPVYIPFAIYGNKAKILSTLKKGARVQVELSPHNKVNVIDGKKYQTVEYTCKGLLVIDWPEREDGTSYKAPEKGTK